MTIDAAACDIQDILFGVMFFGFCFVVAVITGPAWALRRMAAGTISSGAAMIHGESMAADINAAPGVCVMAV